MVINKKKDTDKTPAKQGAEAVISEPNKILATTPFDFQGKDLTAYGGLLLVATMLERLGFQPLVEETLTVKRGTRAMSRYHVRWRWCRRPMGGLHGCTTCGLCRASRC
jgi:hypothetical protein